MEICKDKSNINKLELKNKFDYLVKRNFAYHSFEMHYKDIMPKIIIEKYMGSPLKDYKFFCFNGQPKIMYLSEGFENHKTASMSFFDMDYKLLDIKRKDFKMLEKIPPKPKLFEEMKSISKKLSKDFEHVRVDLYEIDGKIYFSELTFSTGSGFGAFENDKIDLEIGNLWENFSTSQRKIEK